MALGQLGYTIDDSQFEAVDDLLGLPKRADDWMERKASAATDLIAAKSPTAVPGKPDAKPAKFADDAIAEEGESRRWWAFWRKAANDVREAV